MKKIDCFDDLWHSADFFSCFLIVGCILILLKFLGPFILKFLISYLTSEEQEEKTIRVKILSKRFIKWATSYGVIVEFKDGKRAEFAAFDINMVSMIFENDIGYLTHKGSKIIKFDRDIPPKEHESIEPSNTNIL